MIKADLQRPIHLWTRLKSAGNRSDPVGTCQLVNVAPDSLVLFGTAPFGFGVTRRSRGLRS